jgi:hypothetical protein
MFFSFKKITFANERLRRRWKISDPETWLILVIGEILMNRINVLCLFAD